MPDKVELIWLYICPTCGDIRIGNDKRMRVTSEPGLVVCGRCKHDTFEYLEYKYVGRIKRLKKKR